MGKKHMKRKPDSHVQLDDEGRLILPQEIMTRYGLAPGSRIPIDAGTYGVQLRQPVTRLTKLYIEPTNQCNLTCRTCIRNAWDEPVGQMDDATFTHILNGLHEFPSLPTVIFGGFGEPLLHPRIADMVAQVKALGIPVELITNGMLLTEDLSRRLITAGLDVLWVSLDGATAESFADVRLGAELPEIVANVTRFRDIHWTSQGQLPHIGVIFVAMESNIADLPAVIQLGRKLLADRFLITNVLPYTADMRDEVLYSSVLRDIASLPIPWAPLLNMSKMDMNEITREPLYQIARSWQTINYGQDKREGSNKYCPFIEKGSAAICWDGSMSPCLPLMHSHVSFLRERKRFSRRYMVGNVATQSMGDLWSTTEYVDFRERVQAFDFSPCTFCGGCDLSELNEEDCFGNGFPTCGGCLWAQGVIHCP
jgi:MoaA/NifB/PqqE/SkfB family radical SAM enzyme